MTMMSANTHFETGHQAGALRFAFTVLATAILTLILVPAAVLGISYVAGGAAASSILFVYIFALMTNGPFLAAGVAILTGVFATPRLVANLCH